MKRLRIALVSILAFTFALAQAPTPASCQILSFAGAAQCPMPCCRHLMKSMPMSANCPLLNIVRQPDTITPHANFLRHFFMVLSVLPTILTEGSAHMFSRISQVADTFYFLFIERPSLGRAPPCDSSLLSA